MKTIKQLAAEYDAANPPPKKPSRMWKNKSAGVLTPAAEAFLAAEKTHYEGQAAFIEHHISEQVAAAGVVKFNASLREAWQHAEEYGDDDEYYTVERIKAHLLTQPQKAWLQAKDLSVADLLNGRYLVDDEVEVMETFYRPWNDILEANGLSRSFSEEPIGQAMTDSIMDVFRSIDPNITGFTFG